MKFEIKEQVLITHDCVGNVDDYDFNNIIPKYYTLDGEEESVCATDDRTRVLNTSVLPYKAICKLYMRTSTGKNYIGTGWLTHANKLYTAGHCVYDHDEGGWMESIIVVPAKNGSQEPYGRYTSASLVASRGWTENRSQRYDMGAIKLASNVRHNEFLTPTINDSDSVTVCGYPGDRDGGVHQYKMRDAVRKRDDRFWYQLDTFGGQSGAPLLKNNSSSIGIHNYGGCDNSGSDLYAGFIDYVNRW